MANHYPQSASPARAIPPLAAIVIALSTGGSAIVIHAQVPGLRGGTFETQIENLGGEIGDIVNGGQFDTCDHLCPPPRAGDVTGDSVLDARDVDQFTVLLSTRYSTVPEICTGDFDLDGEIGLGDIPGFSQALLQSTDAPSVSIIQNGVIVCNPVYPYEMESYYEGDLPALRAFASEQKIFSGIDMGADWKDREWEMIQAIIRWVSTHTRWSTTGLDSVRALSPPRAIGALNILGSGGRLVAWGDDDEYGNVDWVRELSAPDNKGFVAIATGRNHSMALKDNGLAYQWGKDIEVGAVVPKARPSDFGGCIGIAAGADHAVLLRADGSVDSYGENVAGQCEVPFPNSGFRQIAAGIDFSLGLKNDGTVVVWGALSADVPFDARWQGRFIKVAAGGFHCAGLLDDGTVVAWGSNSHGQCTVPSTIGGTPIQDRVIDIAADKLRTYVMVDFGYGCAAWGTTLDFNVLPTSGYGHLWANPTQNYVVASVDSVPVITALLDAPIPAPARATLTALACDTVRATIVNFGGTDHSATTQLSSTFEWDGREWDEKLPMSMPSARQEHCMVYDPIHEVTVLWGEDSAGAAGSRDVREWNGTSWAGPYATSGTRPSGYLGCSVVFDPHRGAAPEGRVVLFGGRDTTSYFASALDYDAATHTWIDHAIATPGPPVRARHGMVYDSGRDKLVLFGGFNGSQSLNDTWEGPAGGTGGTQFTPVSPSTSPSVRHEFGMAYDSARHVTVLFGGRDGTNYSDETWEYDGSDWTLKTPVNHPGPRAGHGMTYDAEREVVCLFGGFRVGTGIANDTWEYDGTNWTLQDDRIIPAGTIPDLSGTDFVYTGFAPGNRFVLSLADYTFGCGFIGQMAVGLCVAHGIPARLIGGTSLACAGDTTVEVYSTRWNKWIMVWQISGHWMEDAAGAPLSHAEVRAHHAAGNYSLRAGYALGIGKRGWEATPENGSGIVFKPNAIPVPALHPRVPSTYWSETLKVAPISPQDDHDQLELNTTQSIVRLNNPVVETNTILYDDYTEADAVCNYNMSGNPRSSDTDENLSYPLNNVHAEAVLIDVAGVKQVRILLTQNMVPETGGFDHYETSLDGGESWGTISLESVGAGIYNWYPTTSATLMIRGVNEAGVHSPDIAINFTDE